jgi:3-hydroxyisobutyrate dehydrogenase
MGNPMARHLIRVGHELTVFDLRPEAAASLLELGATWADSAAGATSNAEVVFTSLPGPPEVDEAVLSESGILASAREGTVHVDLSTNLPSSVRRLSHIEAAKGVSFLDAPVSGMVAGAEAGTLTVFVGGDEKTMASVQPLLEAFGKNVFHCGPVGTGNILKLTNNLMALSTGLIVQEALLMGVKAGIPAARLYEIWNTASASRLVQGVPQLLKKQFDNPSFSLALAAKDVGLAVEAARELAVPMTVGAAASQVYTRSLAKGLGPLFLSATLLAIEEEAGVTIE